MESLQARHPHQKLRLLQFGSGPNQLSGWDNYDIDRIDIRKPLPFPGQYADGVFLEHVIEHVNIRDAWDFFVEARRILRPGGVLRLAFPDVAKIVRDATPAYDAFLASHGWGDGSRQSSVKSILFNHGHLTGWTSEMMVAILTTLGFEVEVQAVGRSCWQELQGIERHGTQITSESNLIETSVVEARRPETEPEQEG